MVMYTWGPALAPIGLTATTSVLRTPVCRPPCRPPSWPLRLHVWPPPCSGSPGGPLRGLTWHPWRLSPPGARRPTTGQPGALLGQWLPGSCRGLACGRAWGWACCPVSQAGVACPGTTVGGQATGRGRCMGVQGWTGVVAGMGTHRWDPGGRWTCVQGRLLAFLNGEKCYFV
jgi:hypothetical protein